ncbi:hypothetical protein P405_00585 [Streptomyces sp. FR-008]|nr:hypothetical protein P405_00585 [Streptomyces sp. FR-008]
MAFARTYAVTLVGVEGIIVEVQADLEPGVASFALVGLPDKTLVESRDRVRAAVANAGIEWPQRKLTIGLSPASVPKSGSGFDLAVATAVLGAAELIDPRSLTDLVMIGELGLDGRVRPVRGVLPAVLAAAEAGYEQVVVPECSAAEAALVPGISVLGVRTLRQLVAVLTDTPVPEEEPDAPGRPDPLLSGFSFPGAGIGAPSQTADGRRLDFGDVAGQRLARGALEVAAAGGHHIYLKGPPGAGKTMLAERLPGIMPALDRTAALEVTAVHSVAGVLQAGGPLLSRPPYCAPHHSATMQSLVGGGNGLPRPGAVSLAHRGVLFLDSTCKTGAPHQGRGHGTAPVPRGRYRGRSASPCRTGETATAGPSRYGRRRRCCPERGRGRTRGRACVTDGSTRGRRRPAATRTTRRPPRLPGMGRCAPG